MDEWTNQHGQQGQPQQGAPWPGQAQPPLPHAHAQPPAPGQAPAGFVLPGAASGHPPLGFQGGLIGMQGQPPQQQYAQQQQQQHHSAPPQQQFAPGQQPYHQPTHQQPYYAPTQQQFVQHHAQQQQAWAYPTPQGMQLVQGGAAAYAAAPSFQPDFHQPQPQHQPQHQPQAQLQAHPGGSAAPSAPQAMKGRLRWETIVPIVAVLCFLAAVALLISDFDRITGRDGAPSDADRTAAPKDAAAATSPAAAGDIDTALTEATKLLADGTFAAATSRLAPFLAAEQVDIRATKLAARITTASERNDALLARLGRERQAKQWAKVITTVKQLQALRPLSSDLVAIRTQAIKQVQAAAARKRAVAAAKPAVPARPITGGGAPKAGGQQPSSGAAKPPSSAGTPPAQPPKAPNVPNSGGSTTVAPAVTPVAQPQGGEHAGHVAS